MPRGNNGVHNAPLMAGVTSFPVAGREMAPRGEDAEASEGGAPPQPPTNLEVTDWDATSVKLK